MTLFAVRVRAGSSLLPDTLDPFILFIDLIELLDHGVETGQVDTLHTTQIRFIGLSLAQFKDSLGQI